MTPIRFYIDFNSTFSYIAIHQIDDLAARHGRAVDWRVLSLGHLFAAQGIAPPPTVPAKFAYLKLDFPRSCQMAGLPCKLPDPFPPDVKIARQLFWYLKVRDDARARTFAKALSTAVFGHGLPVGRAEEIAAAVPDVTLAEINAAAADPAAKAAVMQALDDAKADGMIGAPFMVLDGEPFWGADRLPHLAARLAGSLAGSLAGTRAGV
jgi:2-hydroxychromene-2-carboxylate isomerase